MIPSPPSCLGYQKHALSSRQKICLSEVKFSRVAVIQKGNCLQARNSHGHGANISFYFMKVLFDMHSFVTYLLR